MYCHGPLSAQLLLAPRVKGILPYLSCVFHDHSVTVETCYALCLEYI